MSDMMTFPDTWEEYEKLYGFNDSEGVYTNNSRLIPSFRVKQWIDHESKQENKQQAIKASDCISRQAAIDAIHNLYAIHGSEGSWIDQKDAFKAILNLPSVNQWIKCSDRLPPLGEEVLVWAYERCCLLTLYAYPNNKGYYWSVEDYDIADDEFDKVVAWMPLPKYDEADGNE